MTTFASDAQETVLQAATFEVILELTVARNPATTGLERLTVQESQGISPQQFDTEVSARDGGARNVTRVLIPNRFPRLSMTRSILASLRYFVFT